MADQRICKAPHCAKPAQSNELCSMHRARLRRGGSFERRKPVLSLSEVLKHRIQFGDWTVLSEAEAVPRPGSGTIRRALCRCACGETRPVFINSLNRGISRHCGCKVAKATAERSLTHGQSGTPEYRSWSHMKGRCLNPTDSDFPAYGGRGITIHAEWVDDFDAFLAYMGKRPTLRHSLDRIEVNGNYGPGNVRWATAHTQASNKRANVRVLFQGQDMSLREACRAAGIEDRYKSVHGLMRKGAAPLDAIEHFRRR
jgi:hypothetical protein